MDKNSEYYIIDIPDEEKKNKPWKKSHILWPLVEMNPNAKKKTAWCKAHVEGEIRPPKKEDRKNLCRECVKSAFNSNQPTPHFIIE